MRRRTLPLSWSLTAAVVGPVLLIVGLGVGWLAHDNVRAMEEEIVRRAEGVAQLTGTSCTLALDRGDREEARRVLERLGRFPDVQVAAVYDPDGRLFASYDPAPEGDGAEPWSALDEGPGPGSRVTGDRVEILQHVDEGDRRHGSVLLRASALPLRTRLERHVQIGLALAGGLLLVAGLLLVGLRRQVSRPLDALARAAEEIARSGSAHTVPREGTEVERLRAAFQRMLDALEARRARQEEAIEAGTMAARRLEALHEVDRAILQGGSPPAIVGDALERLVRVTPCTWALAVEIDPDQHTGAVVGRRPRGPAVAGAGHAFSLRPLRAVVASLELGRPVELPPGEQADALLRAVSGAAPAGILALPLRHEGALLGALVVSPAEAGDYDRVAREVASEVAELLTVALRQVRVEAEVARHTRELERRVARRASEAVSHHRDLEVFNASVAHDLRAPLRAMQGFAMALEEEYANRLDVRGRGYLARIVDGSERMDALIRDLLAYSRVVLARPRLEEVDLDAAVAEAREARSDDPRMQGARVEVRSPLGRVRADREVLLEVLRQLLGNATKFVRPGERPVVRIDARERGPWLRLRVEDEGIGVPPQHRERIFQVFERLHAVSEFPGTGIGLAIVDKGIERMAGRVGLEEGASGGCRFWLELPRCVGSERPDAPPRSGAPLGPGQTQR